MTFLILISLDPKGISKFCKRLNILTEEIHNYETQLIDQIVRYELKADRKNGTDVYEATRYIVQLS